MLDELVRFAVAVVTQWQGLVTGGVVTALLEILKRLWGVTLSKRNYVWLVIVGYLFTAFFFAWRDESRARGKAEADLIDERGRPRLVVDPQSLKADAIAGQKARLSFKLVNSGKTGAAGHYIVSKLVFVPPPASLTAPKSEREATKNVQNKILDEARETADKHFDPERRDEIAPGGDRTLRITGDVLTESDLLRSGSTIQIRRNGQMLLAAALIRYRDGRKVYSRELCLYLDEAIDGVGSFPACQYRGDQETIVVLP